MYAKKLMVPVTIVVKKKKPKYVDKNGVKAALAFLVIQSFK